jgi:hypothetical protein
MSKITINGEELDWPSSQITYYEVEFASGENEPSVTVRFKDKTYRELVRGENVTTEDGMIIDAVNTGRA